MRGSRPGPLLELPDGERVSERLLAALVDPSLLTEHANYLRLTFHPLGARRHIVNWDEVARHLMARAEQELDHAEHDETAVALLSEIRGYAHRVPGDPRGASPPPICCYPSNCW